jgi:signal transduction histidine kinase
VLGLAVGVVAVSAVARQSAAVQNHLLNQGKLSVEPRPESVVGNALKFTPGDELVTVEAAPTPAGDRVRFTVADTGPRITQEHLPHISDRFHQVRATGRAGAGLGLAIARGLVEAHGSTLDVGSEPGERTTFGFDLPVVDPGAR